MAIIKVLRVPQSSRITDTSSDCSVSYSGLSLVGFYLSAEMESVYSAAAADWAMKFIYIRNSYLKLELFIKDYYYHYYY